jgi:hypothetical protein
MFCRVPRVFILALAAAPLAALAQAVGTTTWGASVAAHTEFGADLDRGGDVDVFMGVIAVDGYRQFTPAFGAGVGLRYNYERWSFGAPNAFGGEPWDDIHRPSISVPLVWALSPEVSLGVTPSVAWSYEQGAGTGDALVAGAVLTASRRFSPDLRLGLGVGVFDDIEETKAFPFIVVDWRIDERWRVGNPFRAGPTGGAGVEVAYKHSDAWEFAGGAAWRSERFRLDDDGPAPGGVGETRGAPVFARASWLASRDVRLDFTAGVIVGGKLTLMDPQGHDLVAEDVDPAPFIGITLRTRL